MADKPESKLGRLARLGGLTSQVGSKYLGQRLRGVFKDKESGEAERRQLHIDNARQVARQLGQLKGAAMKVGQSLAQAVDGLDLPEEVGSALRQLNDKAEPVPFSRIRASVERELEAPLSELFAEVDETPLGTASLAQAHVARLHDGREVVFKVLHEGVEDSVATDLLALRSMMVTGRVMNRDKEELSWIFDEIEERLREELDYLQEAANLEELHAALSSLPGVRVPTTVPSHSSERVLTMDRLPGVSLEEFLKTAGPEARQAAGRNLTLAFFEMVYEARALHADPHEGNYLFEPDGTLGIVDFGCVKRYSEHWVADYARVGELAFSGQRDECVEILKEMGGLGSDKPEDEQLLWDFVDTLAKPFRSGRMTAGGPRDTVDADLKAMAPRFVTHPKVRTPRQMVFMHRSLGGTYAMLKRLQARQDWGAIAAGYHARAIARAEGRPVPPRP
jgi:predicted unusual protein kinase regulating ubiquinone biosynthesis (AarF/ABC1/UbiB family)